MATINRKGQITLPPAIREALGLEPGAQVEFEIEQDSVRLRRLVSRTSLEQWAGCLPPSGEFADVDALMEDLRTSF